MAKYQQSTFILKLLLRHFFKQKGYSKKNLVNPNSPNGLKVVLIVLAEIIAFLIQVAKISFQYVGFQDMLPRSYFN